MSHHTDDLSSGWLKETEKQLEYLNKIKEDAIEKFKSMMELESRRAKIECQFINDIIKCFQTFCANARDDQMEQEIKDDYAACINCDQIRKLNQAIDELQRQQNKLRQHCQSVARGDVGGDKKRKYWKQATDNAIETNNALQFWGEQDEQELLRKPANYMRKENEYLAELTKQLEQVKQKILSIPRQVLANNNNDDDDEQEQEGEEEEDDDINPEHAGGDFVPVTGPSPMSCLFNFASSSVDTVTLHHSNSNENNKCTNKQARQTTKAKKRGSSNKRHFQYDKCDDEFGNGNSNSNDYDEPSKKRQKQMGTRGNRSAHCGGNGSTRGNRSTSHYTHSNTNDSGNSNSNSNSNSNINSNSNSNDCDKSLKKEDKHHHGRHRRHRSTDSSSSRTRHRNSKYSNKNGNKKDKKENESRNSMSASDLDSNSSDSEDDESVPVSGSKYTDKCVEAIRKELPKMVKFLVKHHGGWKNVQDLTTDGERWTQLSVMGTHEMSTQSEPHGIVKYGIGTKLKAKHKRFENRQANALAEKVKKLIDVKDKRVKFW